MHLDGFLSFAAEIRVAEGNVEEAVSSLIEKVSPEVELSLPQISAEVVDAAQDQQLSNEEAIAQLMQGDGDIESAVNSWTGMSTAEKQELVDRANSNGLLGCSSCSVADAEEFVKEVA